MKDIRCILGWHKWYETVADVRHILTGRVGKVRDFKCERCGCRESDHYFPMIGYQRLD